VFQSCPGQLHARTLRKRRLRCGCGRAIGSGHHGFTLAQRGSGCQGIKCSERVK